MRRRAHAVTVGLWATENGEYILLCPDHPGQASESCTECEPDPKKPCTLCGIEYPLKDFGHGKPGRNSERCTNCRQPGGRLREHQLEIGRSTSRERNLRRLYAISVEEYDRLRSGQEYRCAICRRHEDELITKNVGRPRKDGQPSAEAMKLHVDHDHKTNEIRGLLCGPCNSGIASFQDRADWLSNAIEYLSSRA